MRRLLTGVVCGFAFSFSIWTATVWADVIVERYSKSGGFAGMGAFEGTTLTVTSTTAQREESSVKFTGAVLGALQRMAGGSDSVRITRLDREVVWTLDPKAKSYEEEPLTRLGEMKRLEKGQAREKDESSDVVVTRNELKVEKTGAKKTINGFPCEEYVMTWLVETLDKKSGETGKSAMTNRLWNTPETADIRAAQAEEQAYQKAYLKKVGLEMSPQEARMFLAGLTGLSEQEQQKVLARVSAEMAKIQGYSIVSQLEWNLEGNGGAAGGREGGSAGGGDTAKEVQALVKGLGKLFGGGGEKSGRSESSDKGEGGGALLTFYNEVKSIRRATSDPSRYEVPADFKRR